MSAASDRLARSRLAIIEHVHRRQVRKDRHPPAAQRARREAEPSKAATPGNGGWLATIKRAARTFWQHHPAHMGVQVAMPLLARSARRNPAAYVATAAAVGAALMIARPWRLVSVTGVLVALAKSPQLAGAVMSAMSGGDWDDDTA